MTGLREHNCMRTPLFIRAAQMLKPCDVLLDIGCGIRPQNMVKCKRQIWVEPHGEYAAILENAGYEVVARLANQALDEIDVEVDTVMALDVIEHMEKDEGAEFIRRALNKAKKQVVVFTPFGFMPQEEDGETDAWGMHGQEFQRHRSGWLPEEFEGWKCITDMKFHNLKGAMYGAFFAVHTA